MNLLLLIITTLILTTRVEGGVWTQLAPTGTLPPPIDDSAATVTDGVLVVFGGKTGIGTNNELWLFDTKCLNGHNATAHLSMTPLPCGEWVHPPVVTSLPDGSPAPPLPETEDHAVAEAGRGSVFFFDFSTLYFFNASAGLASGTHRVVGPFEPLPGGTILKDSTATGMSNATHFNVLVFSGLKRNVPGGPHTAEAYLFSLRKSPEGSLPSSGDIMGSWTYIPPHPDLTPREDSYIARVGSDKAYVYGGAGPDDAFDDLWEFDLRSLNWTQIHRGAGDAVVWPPPAEDQVIVPTGGDGSPETADGFILHGAMDSGFVYLFDVASGLWSVDKISNQAFKNNSLVQAVMAPMANHPVPDLFVMPFVKDHVGGPLGNGRGAVIYSGSTESGRSNLIWVYQMECPNNCSRSIPGGGSNTCSPQGVCVCDPAVLVPDLAYLLPLYPRDLRDGLPYPDGTTMMLHPDCEPQRYVFPSPPPPPPSPPPPPPPPPSPPVKAVFISAPSSEEEDTRRTAVILGTVIPVVCVLCMCVFLLLFLRRRRSSLVHHLTLDAHADICINASELIFLDELGRGSYGVVHRARYRNNLVAVKQLLVRGMGTPGLTTTTPGKDDYESALHAKHAMLHEFASEASILLSCRHPNVTLLMGIVLEPPSLVSEFMVRGSLYGVISDLRWTIHPSMVYSWSAGLISGLSYLHSRGITHRDLKSLNVLLSDGWAPKITDFGLSTMASHNESEGEGAHQGSGAHQMELETNADVGTLLWTGPEILVAASKGESIGEEAYVMADVYSLGVVLWEIVTREAPYGTGADPVSVGHQIVEGRRALDMTGVGSSVRPEFVSVLQGCLERSPTARTSLEDAGRVLDSLYEPARVVFPAAILEPEGDVHVVAFAVPQVQGMLLEDPSVASVFLQAFHKAVSEVCSALSALVVETALDSVTLVLGNTAHASRVLSLVRAELELVFERALAETSGVSRVPLAVLSLVRSGTLHISGVDPRTAKAVYSGALLDDVNRILGSVKALPVDMFGEYMAESHDDNEDDEVDKGGQKKSAKSGSGSGSGNGTGGACVVPLMVLHCKVAGEAKTFVDTDFERAELERITLEQRGDGGRLESVVGSSMGSSVLEVWVASGGADEKANDVLSAIACALSTQSSSAEGQARLYPKEIVTDAPEDVVTLGTGSCGRVFVRGDLFEESADVAVKELFQQAVGIPAVTRMVELVFEMASRVALCPVAARLRGICADSGSLALVSDFVGPSLASVQIPPSSRGATLTAMCRALGRLHASGLIHGNLKPANIHVTLSSPLASGSGEPVVMFSDVGLAELASNFNTMTMAPSVMYMAPEKVRGEPNSGGSDVYSLALCLVYAWHPEVLMARFRDKPAMAAVHEIMMGVPAQLVREGGLSLPSRFADVLVACLGRDVDSRPGVDELVEACSGL